ncbi:hypothetical protein [Arenimonas sp. MALMAid1274]|uniref:hypothetical protein n=1 Tax=Arenimonas sp. MALMAid1274 TaxID=3411630 RepID=UPI003B9ECDED
MIARALAGLALVGTVLVAAPWSMNEVAADDTRVLAPVSSAAEAPVTRLHAAIENATRRQVPGAAGSGWVLHTLDRSGPGLGGQEHIVATGVITTPGAPDTELRLTGRYDPDTGELTRVAYRLQPNAERARTLATTDTTWSVQRAVQQAFGEVEPDAGVVFALDSAQSTRVEGGGRRFEGSGIGSWGQGDARFVAFTMTVSRDGELVAFDYSAQPGADSPDYVAGY